MKLVLDAGRRVLRVGVTDEAILERLPALCSRLADAIEQLMETRDRLPV